MFLCGLDEDNIIDKLFCLVSFLCVFKVLSCKLVLGCLLVYLFSFGINSLLVKNLGSVMLIVIFFCNWLNLLMVFLSVFISGDIEL